MGLLQEIDSKYLNKEGFLSEKDYKIITDNLSLALKDFRVTSVKKFLLFEPRKYEFYRNLYKSGNDIYSSRSEADFELIINNIFYDFEFDSSFFPQLTSETTVFEQFILGGNNDHAWGELDYNSGLSNWIPLESLAYKSIMSYHHQVSSELKKRVNGIALFKDSIIYNEVSSKWIPFGKSSFHRVLTTINFEILM